MVIFKSLLALSTLILDGWCILGYWCWIWAIGFQCWRLYFSAMLAIGMRIKTKNWKFWSGKLRIIQFWKIKKGQRNKSIKTISKSFCINVTVCVVDFIPTFIVYKCRLNSFARLIRCWFCNRIQCFYYYSW